MASSSCLLLLSSHARVGLDFLEIRKLFYFACKNGHAEVVRLLLADGRVDPAARDNSAIRHASKNGHSEVVRLLLQDSRVNPAGGDGSRAIVKLQPRVARPLLQDGSTKSLAVSLLWAIYAGMPSVCIIRMLLKDGHVDPTLQSHFYPLCNPSQSPQRRSNSAQGPSGRSNIWAPIPRVCAEVARVLLAFRRLLATQLFFVKGESRGKGKSLPGKRCARSPWGLKKSDPAGFARNMSRLGAHGATGDVGQCFWRS